MFYSSMIDLIRRKICACVGLIATIIFVSAPTFSNAAPPVDVQKLNFLYVELGKCGMRRDPTTDDLVYEAVKFAAMNSPGFVTPNNSLDAKLNVLAKLMIEKLKFEFSDGSVCAQYKSAEMIGLKLFKFVATHAVIGIVDVGKK